MNHRSKHGAAPCELLVRYVDLLPTAACALDLACGAGGNALLLARRGLQTTAVDNRADAITRATRHAHEAGLDIDLCRVDAARSLTPSSYDVIVVSRFLDRGLARPIESALKPGGMLYYQTFTVDTASACGPRNRNYLLARNELLRLFPNLTVLVYHEPLIPGMAGLVARRPES